MSNNGLVQAIAKGIAAAIVFLASTSASAVFIEEIIVTAPLPGQADHSLDTWWFDQHKIRIDGSWDADMDAYDYYLDMQDDYEECLDISDAKVSQCKSVYGTEGSMLCGLSVLYAMGFLGRFAPDGTKVKAGGASGGLGRLYCEHLNEKAFKWCETTFRSRMVKNCMDQDDS